MSSNPATSTVPGAAPLKSRRKRKAATRQALKDAAIRSFRGAGYAATGIAAITEAAGVAHGTFYVHFPNKEALMDELLAEHNATLAARLQPVLAAAAASDDSLAARVRAAAEIFLDHWHDTRDFIAGYAQRSAAGLRLESLRDGVNPPMANLLTAVLSAAARDRDGARQVDWALASQALLAMWLRVGLQYLFGHAVERTTAVETLVRMSVGAVEGMLATSAAR